MNETLLQNDGAGSLPDRIYARVVEAILRGDFAPHNKLPTEEALSAQFGVSRPTVREALARLRSDGIIDSRRGAGSTVIRAPGTPVVVATPVKSLADIERYYAFRSCVEMGAAAGAAEFRDADDLEALQLAFEALNTAMEGGESGTDEDVRFHLAIARASHNPFFVTTIDTTVAPGRAPGHRGRHRAALPWRRGRGHSYPHPERQTAYLREHTAALMWNSPEAPAALSPSRGRCQWPGGASSTASAGRSTHTSGVCVSSVGASSS